MKRSTMQKTTQPNTKMKNTSIPNGTQCRFHLKGTPPQEFGFDGEADEHPLHRQEGAVCTVKEIELADEEGDRNNEYYNVQFAEIELEAVSGFHLTPLSEEVEQDVATMSSHTAS